ncbi:hypothetical protein [Chondromyces crocatus]|uniref:STAS domain-containing protein n=1 Tax=Chondromyces crocatus TaxID=52 RepID=A0A0K1EDM9_CHOCO|nr:hypothetical protein [Chondromyces crocatus]AKT38959.1 uncharacterized protein CMC5_031060 [Chondromyces crocatus]
MLERFRSPHLVVAVDEAHAHVRVTRTAEPFRTLEELQAAYATLIPALDAIGRAGRTLLVDLRSSPGRNDAAFEQAMRALRPSYLGGYTRVGVLVQSVIGAMQVQRYAREDGIERLITADGDALAAHLGIHRALIPP